MIKMNVVHVQLSEGGPEVEAVSICDFYFLDRILRKVCNEKKEEGGRCHVCRAFFIYSFNKFECCHISIITQGSGNVT